MYASSYTNSKLCNVSESDVILLDGDQTCSQLKITFLVLIEGSV